MRLALFFKVMSLESGPNTKIRSWSGEMRCRDGRRRCGDSHGTGVTGPRVREPCSQQERVFHRAFARLPLAWCTFPVEFAPRSAPVPDQHADPRPRGRARPGPGLSHVMMR